MGGHREHMVVFGRYGMMSVGMCGKTEDIGSGE